jgi:hypothetical protein
MGTGGEIGVGIEVGEGVLTGELDRGGIEEFRELGGDGVAVEGVELGVDEAEGIKIGVMESVRAREAREQEGGGTGGWLEID